VKYKEAILRAIHRHVATVTRHRRGCCCAKCCEARARAKRYARVMGWLRNETYLP
jgi:hypothetical protein